MTKRSKSYRSKRKISVALKSLCDYVAARWGVSLPIPKRSLSPSDHGLLVAASDASKQLGVSGKTLANWRCSGVTDLLFVKIGSRVFYRQEHLDAFITGMTKQSTSDRGGSNV